MFMPVKCFYNQRCMFAVFLKPLGLSWLAVLCLNKEDY